MRVGIGYDSHAFATGRKLILGGVEIPNAKGLAGHSDADAVAHALTDAILGAAGLGDIGRMFPNDDPQWKDASSIDLLNKAFLKVGEAGFQFVHADVTIIMEQPKLAPYVDAMEERLAEALRAGPAQVSVKAKTNEGMGWIGRGEGVAVLPSLRSAEAQESPDGLPRVSPAAPYRTAVRADRGSGRRRKHLPAVPADVAVSLGAFLAGGAS